MRGEFAILEKRQTSKPRLKRPARKSGALRNEGRNGTFRTMSAKMIEQQLAELQKRVATLETQSKPSPKATWRDAVGFAKDDELFEQAMSLGAELRARANREGR